MKIEINYDFINAIKNINEPYNIYKIVRNNKKNWLFFPIPELLLIDILSYKNMEQILTALTIEMGVLSVGEYFIGKTINKDKYYEKSSKNIRLLSNELNYNNFNTNYNLLLNSELYHKEYNISLNKYKLPLLLESKFILVPTYDRNDNIKKRSIKQDHIIGDNKYILTSDIPVKEKKLVLTH